MTFLPCPEADELRMSITASGTEVVRNLVAMTFDHGVRRSAAVVRFHRVRNTRGTAAGFWRKLPRAESIFLAHTLHKTLTCRASFRNRETRQTLLLGKMEIAFSVRSSYIGASVADQSNCAREGKDFTLQHAKLESKATAMYTVMF